jgi:large conductance mechanosensitive channel
MEKLQMISKIKAWCAKKFFREFRDFALKGNVMSMAVGVMVGVAFQGLITSLTENILSPIIGLLVRQNFDYLELNVFGTTLRYGAFLTTLLNFVIMAFVVFMIVRIANRLLNLGKKTKQETEPPPTCPYCKSKVHKDATRCPSCTSVLEQTEVT